MQQDIKWVGEAFGAQYASLIRFLLAHLRHRQDAEDLAQEAFLRLMRVPQAELIRQPDAYLFRIAANLLSEFRMRSRRTSTAVVFDSEQATKASEAADSAVATPTETLMDAEQLRWAIDQLPARIRTALILHRRDGLTYAQIGELLGVSGEMVKKYIAAGVAGCRQAFGGER